MRGAAAILFGRYPFNANHKGYARKIARADYTFPDDVEVTLLVPCTLLHTFLDVICSVHHSEEGLIIALYLLIPDRLLLAGR